MEIVLFSFHDVMTLKPINCLYILPVLPYISVFRDDGFRRNSCPVCTPRIPTWLLNIKYPGNPAPTSLYKGPFAKDTKSLSAVTYMIFSRSSHEILKIAFFQYFTLLSSDYQAMSALVTIKVMHTCLLPAWCHVFCQCTQCSYYLQTGSGFVPKFAVLFMKTLVEGLQSVWIIG